MSFKIKYSAEKDIQYNTPVGNMPCRNIECSEFYADSEYLAKCVIKDILDPPEAELTRTQISADFGDGSKWPITEERITALQIYFNGRLALFQKIMRDLKLNNEKSKTLKYDIPDEYNYFSALNDSFDEERQRNTYIEIEIN